MGCLLTCWGPRGPGSSNVWICDLFESLFLWEEVKFLRLLQHERQQDSWCHWAVSASPA